MNRQTGTWPVACVLIALTSAAACADAQPVNDSAAAPGEWGFRPLEGRPSPTNPPAFVWRPQKDAVAYELQCARDTAFKKIAHQATVQRYNCHCPPKALAEGTWHWRFRFIDKKSETSAWSTARVFIIDKTAVAFPMPPRSELLGRIPKRHPRLFLRPEQLPRLRQLAKGELKKEFDALVKECERLLKNPPPSAEPPTYPKGTVRKSEDWRKTWWGNRVHTIRCLNGAATLGFTWRLSGNDAYGRLAKRLLMAAAEWDTKGSTGYRYNDEAGMPYNYYFSRTYTFIHDLLSEKEKARCRQVMTVRGREMYDHLARRHLWRPYASHSNRAWHWLGEVGVAFLDEIPDAEEWVWFAMNVFYNVYPAWSDADGGWHEGASYWAGYIHRFTWWADAMRVAMDVNAYRKPYFSQVGYYPMSLQPPGTRGGGFGDLCAARRSSNNRALMTILAAQARNPHWQWYVDVHGGPRAEGGYIGFIRGALPKVDARPPDDLPTSRCFRGTGLAMLNTNLAGAADNVQVIFKSSPFGTQSHGYESNNSFLLYAFGERLLIRTGRRDIYGSLHHKNWMWHTKSTNCITVGGEGQTKHSAATRGRVLGFHASRAFDYVAGEAGSCYGKTLERFTRHILFVKPGMVVVFDRVKAPKAGPLEWHLHAPTEMTVNGPGDIRVTVGKAACRVSLLAPKGLEVSQTNRFDPPPRPRVKLTEWHVTARTPPVAQTEFVTVIRPHRAGKTVPSGAALHQVKGGYALEADLSDPDGPGDNKGGRVVVLLRSRDSGAIEFGRLKAAADLAAVRFDAARKATDHILVTGRQVRAGSGKLPGY